MSELEEIKSLQEDIYCSEIRLDFTYPTDLFSKTSRARVE